MTEAVQILNKSTRLDITWCVTQGLVLIIDGEEAARLPLSSPAPENVAGGILVIGYPGLTYMQDYEVNLLVREFTVYPVSRTQILVALDGKGLGAV